MRASVTSFTKKFISFFFAASLAAGLIPAAAFAVDDENGEAADAVSIEMENRSTLIESEDESTPVSVGAEPAPSNGEEGTEDDVQALADANLSIPAATQRVNEDVVLQTRTVAQAESTRNYFLAQTLESTRTVPIVSANLPLDTGNGSDAATEENEESSDDESDEDSEPVGASFSLRTEGDQAESGFNGIAASSTVIGSFTYNGITYAVEPGGETVAAVAADYNQLPETFIENQVIALPSVATADGLDYYAVSRIADDAFSSMKHEEDEGIIAIAVPASVTNIGDDAFTGFDTLQYILVLDGNPNYASYDGALYSADLDQLRLIPEGRVGTVRVAPSATSALPEVFSHCPSVDTLVADPDCVALTSEEGFLRELKLGEPSLRVVIASNEIGTVGQNDRIERMKNFAAEYAFCSDEAQFIGEVIQSRDLYGSNETVYGNGGSLYGYTVTYETDGTNLGRELYTTYDHNGGVHWTITDEKWAPFRVMAYPDYPAVLEKTEPSNGKKYVRWFEINGVKNSGFSYYSSGSEYYTYGSFPFEHTTNLYAVYPLCNVILDMRGGSLSSHSIQVRAGQNMPTITPPYLLGYTFEGYYDTIVRNQVGGKRYINYQGRSENTWDKGVDTTLYAKYTPNDYRITLDLDGGNDGTTAFYERYDHGWYNATTTSINEAATIDAIRSPQKTGYTFGGYYTDKDGKGTKMLSAPPAGSRSISLASVATDTWTSDTKLYAYWIPNDYLITCDLDRGDNTFYRFIERYNTDWYNTKSDNNGGFVAATRITSITKPTRTGYTFGGYYTKKNGKGDLVIAPSSDPAATTLSLSHVLKTTWTANSTLYAYWSPNSYEITWNANGGLISYTSTSVETSQLYGEKLTLPNEPKRTDYAFMGWFTDPTNGTQVTSNTAVPSGNTTYYAHWDRWTIALDAGEGIIYKDGVSTGKSILEILAYPQRDYTCARGASSDLTLRSIPPDAPDTNHSVTYTVLRDGYVQTAWVGSSGTSYSSVNDWTCPTASGQSFTATWRLADYTLTLDDQGATTAGSGSVTATYDTELPSVKVPLRYGFSFLGYYAEPDGEGMHYYDEQGQPMIDKWTATQGATLYAAWQEKSTKVHFDTATPDDTEKVHGAVEGQTWVFDEALPEKLPMPSEETFTRHGYQFKGWYYEDKGADGTSSATKRFVSNADGSRRFEKWDRDFEELTLKAEWKANEYVLLFNEDHPTLEGEEEAEPVVHKVEVAYDAPLTVADPEFEPYTFVGWYLTAQPDTAFFDTHVTDGRFTPQGDLASQVSPAKIEVEATWLAPGENFYHLYAWTPGASDANVSVTSGTYAYGDTVTLGKSTYPAKEDGWNPAGWVEVTPATDEAARALIANGGPDASSIVTSSFGPRERTEKFFVFKWTKVPFSVSFKDAPSGEGDEAYVKASDVLVDATVEGDDAPLSWSAVCAATSTGNATHATHLSYDVTTASFALPTVQRRGYDFKGWKQLSPAVPEVGEVIDPKTEIAPDPALHTLVFEPVFEASEYTIVLHPGAEGREVKRIEGVKYTDTFTMPYPDVLNTGACFSSWATAKTDALSSTKTFAPEDQVPVAKGAPGTVCLSDYADENKEIHLWAIWNSAYNVTVPVRVTTMAIDTETGDMVAAANALEPAYDEATYEVLSLRMEPLSDDDGNVAFSGVDAGRVYLSVYPNLAEPEDELSLFKRSALGEKGVISYTDKAGTSRTATPLLLELGDDAVQFVNKGTDEEASPLSKAIGFTAFTKASPLKIRYALHFEGVSPKQFAYEADADRWTLPENDAKNTVTTENRQVAWSGERKGLAKLCYTVQLVETAQDEA